MARMTPETRTRLEGFKAIKVKHPRLDEVDQQVTQAIDEHAGYTHLLLYGPSGVGKSTVIRRIAERFCADDPHPARVPVVLIEARPSDTGTYVRLDYYRQVLRALKAHVVVKELFVNIATAPTPTRGSRHVTEWLDLREAVEHALERLHVQAVVIDEAQHLMQVAAPLKPADQLDWLKSMTNRTNVLHVLVGTYDLCDFRNLHGQAARRGRDLHFPRYHVDTATERQEFVGALRYLLEHVPLSCDVNALLAHWRWFADCSVGCVGILKDWLVQTVAATLGEAGATLTHEALARHALQPAQRVRLEVEARAGEQKVEVGNATGYEQLQALLGSPASPRRVPLLPLASPALPGPGAPSIACRPQTNGLQTEPNGAGVSASGRRRVIRSEAPRQRPSRPNVPLPGRSISIRGVSNTARRTPSNVPRVGPSARCPCRGMGCAFPRTRPCGPGRPKM
jgi:DNA polymerase III delta prime subunit